MLEEARDATVPLLERLKFLAIVASNLDEFFMVRVAGLKQQLSGNVAETPPDGLTPAEQLAAISARAHAMVAEQYRIWREEVGPRLEQAGVRMLRFGQLTPEQRASFVSYFSREVWPVLTPLAVDPGHPFPMLRNRSLNLAILLHREREKVAAPPDHHRRRAGPVGPGAHQRGHAGTGAASELPAAAPPRFSFMLLEDLIAMHAGDLFPGFRVVGCSAFRVTRNFDLSIDEDEADDLLKTIQKELRRRERGSAVRLEIAHDTPAEVVTFLRSALRLENDDVYRVDGPLHLADLAPIDGPREDLRDLRDEPFSPQIVPPLQEYDDIFRVIAQRDILLQHPYESFEDVVEFISEAADDPNVLAIKQTLYRTSADSPIVRALIRAAENGKQVTAVVELKARFDEAPNIQWARALEDAGVHVVYGLIGPQDPLQGGAGRAARGRPHQALRPPVDRQLQPDDRAHLRRSVLLHRARRLRRRRGRAVQPAHRATRRRRRGSGSRSRRSACRSASSRSSIARRRLGARGRIIAKMNALVDATGHQGALPRVAGGRADRPHRARHLLPAPGRAGHQRQHPRHQHRRPLPRARAHLLFRQRRQARGLPVVGRLDAAQLPAPRRGHVPRSTTRACATASSTRSWRSRWPTRRQAGVGVVV